MPETAEEAEAWRLLWPVPPLRMSAAGPIGIDVAELRARVRRGLDGERVAQMAQMAEGAVLMRFARKDGEAGE